MPHPFLAAVLVLALAQAGAPTPRPPEEMENGRCPVTGQGLPQEPEYFAVAAMGGTARRYAVCCRHCVQELQRRPGKYLRRDGRPKNEKA